MTSGGHARSGPAPDPNSLRGAKRPAPDLRVLPLAGFDGEPPKFPLPDDSFDERSVWQFIWRTPQATVWINEQWRWLTIAMYARTYVRCSVSDSRTADVNSLHRLADQIGLTPMGLKENGWTIEKPATEKAERATPTSSAASARDRFTVHEGGKTD